MSASRGRLAGPLDWLPQRMLHFFEAADRCARRGGANLRSWRSMDDIVKQAMAKWPNVPHCYGWLALDARGDWRMRDERPSAHGAARRQADEYGAARLHQPQLPPSAAAGTSRTGRNGCM